MTVGAGMNAFSRTMFSVVVQGAFEPAPATLYLATHRSERDVPLVCGEMYPRLHGRSEQGPWFAVREDLLLPGFFAHVAPGLLPLSLGVGSVLTKRLRCIPVRPANRMRLIELVRTEPSLPLDRLPFADEFRARARGRRPPSRAGDLLVSRYADLLWRTVDRATAPEPAAAWATRVADARRDLASLIALLQSGESLLLFPEGEPSKDGAVAPLKRGVELVVRRGRPERIVPIGIAYDPLRRGRTRAVVRFGDPVPPPTEQVEASLHRLLRRTLPRTQGAALAYAYRHGHSTVRPEAPAQLIERLAREFESAEP
jgi:1-acyl-sn-glycerol-3-phosphate acyltransferase